MGLVLPAELLSVNYAAQIRRFVMEHFSEVRLVMFDQRVFPGVQEEVVLLLADGYHTGSTDHAVIVQLRGPDELSGESVGYRWSPTTPEAKWTPSLLSGESLEAYAHATHTPSFTTLDHWGDTTLGMVTGNNRFFALSPARVRELGLARSDVIRLSPPGSRHLRGTDLTASQLRALGRAGSATWLFRPRRTPSSSAEAYIRAGHLSGVDTAYKCRVRTPWWRVPLVRPADMFVTYMNADTPRITANTVGAHHLNSVHGLYLSDEARHLKALLPLAALNSVTLLGAEIVGRSYGGGMLKLEPSEADHLPVPAASIIERAAAELSAARPAIEGYLAAGKLLAAVSTVDGILLPHTGHQIDTDQMLAIRTARAGLAARRRARGTEPVAP